MMLDTTAETMPTAETDESQGNTVMLPGQTPQGNHVLSVLLKRTYDIVPDRHCVRAEEDRPVVPGDVPWEDPMNSSMRFESDYVPYKLATDVVLNGKAYAPDGRPTTACIVAVKVADHRKDVYVFGDRKALYKKNATPAFSDPEPFTTMDLKYERAYGGVDVYSDKKTSYAYPRNPLGRGFIVDNTKEGIEHLQLPNLEDPRALLTPEQLCVAEYSRWQDQPMPAGLGWFPKYWQPRAELAGIMPADRPVEKKLRKAYSKFLPADQRKDYLNSTIRDMDFRFFNGASPGLVVPYLSGDEKIYTGNLCAEGNLFFYLPGDRPEIGMDIGEGLTQTHVVMHTVMIHMEERQVDIVWRGTIPYPGPDWLVNMQKLEIIIT